MAMMLFRNPLCVCVCVCVRVCACVFVCCVAREACNSLTTVFPSTIIEVL